MNYTTYQIHKCIYSTPLETYIIYKIYQFHSCGERVNRLKVFWLYGSKLGHCRSASHGRARQAEEVRRASFIATVCGWFKAGAKLISSPPGRLTVHTAV